MMGGHHAACGAAAWIALTSDVHIPLDLLQEQMHWLPDSLPLGTGLIDSNPVSVLSGSLVCAGAALLPDADHHNASIAYALPPFTKWAAEGVGKISGGHRHGTHSLIGIGVFTLLSALPQLVLAGLTALGVHAPTWADVFGNSIWPGLWAVMLVSFAVKVLKFLPDGARRAPWVVGLLAGALVATLGSKVSWWFPICVAVGVVVHILGDMMTVGGVNLVWPKTWKPPKVVTTWPVIKHCWMKNGYMAVPVLGKAGSAREWLLLIPISLYATIGMIAAVVAGAQFGLAQLIH